MLGVGTATVAFREELSVKIAQARLTIAENLLRAADERLEAAERGLFFGTDRGDLSSLDAELRGNRAIAALTRTEVATLEAKTAGITALRDAESARVDLLKAQDIRSPKDIVITSINGRAGASTTAGDTIARGVDCANAIAVAIFPERMAGRLSAGMMMMVEAEGWGRRSPAASRASCRASPAPRTWDTPYPSR